MLDFKIPERLIAQFPVEPRDTCKLMCLDRKTQNISEYIFRDILEILNSGDLLVFNNTKVIKARLLAKKETGGAVEILLLNSEDNGLWKALVSGKKIREGLTLFLEDNIRVNLVEHVEKGVFIIKFLGINNIIEYTNKYGKVPLPPYIKRESTSSDETMYQTVFASNLGSVASPTASLHFTNELLDSLKIKGVNFAYLTLHVGYGTFAPLKDIKTHIMHTEEYSVPQGLEEQIKHTKQRGNRVIAVGTTVVRTLESAFDSKLNLVKPQGKTDLFIHHDYQFKVPDALITNFHHHSTTLIHLVGAFAGYDFINKAYNEAISKEYRMLSYGDAMFIC